MCAIPSCCRGREGRWHWPWAINGLLLTALLFVLLSIGVIVFEDVAVRQNWVRGGFPQNVFPLDPAQPITYLDVLIASLPFLIAPLIALPLAHGVSWRRAFSYGGGFRWGQFWRAALALLLLALLALALGYALEPQQYRFPARPPGHLFWIGLAMVVIFVQSLGEEVMFRGYLLRAWGAVLPFRLPVTGAVIALFVTGHLWNEDLQRDLLVNVIYFVAGEIIAYAVLFRTQNLAASAGPALDEQRACAGDANGAGSAHGPGARHLHRSRLHGRRQPPARPSDARDRHRRRYIAADHVLLAPLAVLSDARGRPGAFNG